MKKHLFAIPLAASLLVLGTEPALAQSPAAAAADSHSSHYPAAAASTTPQAELSEGEITRWDPRTLRLTLKHGEIKNLEMPPMTMVFGVRDKALLDRVKPGDKVRFSVEKSGARYVITALEVAP